MPRTCTWTDPFRGGAERTRRLRGLLQDVRLPGGLTAIVDRCLSGRKQRSWCWRATCSTPRIARSARGWRSGGSWTRLDAAGIRTFIVHGNHDPLSGDQGAIGLSGVGEGLRPRARGGRGRAPRRGEEVPGPGDLVRAGEGAPRTSPGGSRRRGPGVHHRGAPRQRRRHLRPRELRAVHGGQSLGSRAGGLGAGPRAHPRRVRAGLRWRRGGVPRQPAGTARLRERGARGCIVVNVEEGEEGRRFVAVDRVRWHRCRCLCRGSRRWGALAAAVRSRWTELLGRSGRARGAPHAQGPGAAAPRSWRARRRWAAAIGVERALLAGTGPCCWSPCSTPHAPELELETVRRSGGFSESCWRCPRCCVSDPESRRAVGGGRGAAGVGAKLRRLGVEALETPRPEWVEQAAVRAVEQLHEEEGT